MVPAGEFSWDVRVAAVARDKARVFVRKHQFEVGVPLAFDSEADGATALETVLGAIGADVVLGLQRTAARRRLAVEALEATVQATLHNPLAYLRVVGETGEPGIRSIRVRVYITTADAAAAVTQAWQETLATSPLVCTFRRALDLEITHKTIL